MLRVRRRPTFVPLRLLPDYSSRYRSHHTDAAHFSSILQQSIHLEAVPDDYSLRLVMFQHFRQLESIIDVVESSRPCLNKFLLIGQLAVLFRFPFRPRRLDSGMLADYL